MKKVDKSIKGGGRKERRTRMALANAPTSCATATKAIEPESNQLLLSTLIRQQKVS